MDQNAIKPETSPHYTTVRTESSIANLLKNIAVGLLFAQIIIIFSLLGLNYFKIIDLQLLPPIKTVITSISIDQSKLPISAKLLQNPIVYEWRGSVSGKVTKKTDHEFTLSNNKGDSITITNVSPITGLKWNVEFLDKSNNDKPIPYSAIQTGDTLLGDFFIFKNHPETAVGSMFLKQ